jgi:hypothetical protein
MRIARTIIGVGSCAAIALILSLLFHNTRFASVVPLLFLGVVVVAPSASEVPQGLWARYCRGLYLWRLCFHPFAVWQCTARTTEVASYGCCSAGLRSQICLRLLRPTRMAKANNRLRKDRVTLQQTLAEHNCNLEAKARMPASCGVQRPRLATSIP